MVTEIHGTQLMLFRMQYKLQLKKFKVLKNSELPLCACGGFIKTATISFGQPTPERDAKGPRGSF